MVCILAFASSLRPVQPQLHSLGAAEAHHFRLEISTDISLWGIYPSGIYLWGMPPSDIYLWGVPPTDPSDIYL